MPVITKLSLKEIESIKKTIREDLLTLAVRKGIIASKPDGVIRDILPKTDLGFTNEEWLETVVANDYSTIIDMDLSEKQILAIYGIRLKASTPLTSLIKFSIGAGGAKVKDIIEIEGAEKQKEREAILQTPILYENGDHIFIEFYGKSAGDDRVILLGYICEPKGEIVSKS